MGRELARIRTGEEEPTPIAFRHAVRDVIRECIYAVDKNPLAVDLCKVALWIRGITPVSRSASLTITSDAAIAWLVFSTSRFWRKAFLTTLTKQSMAMRRPRPDNTGKPTGRTKRSPDALTSEASFDRFAAAKALCLMNERVRKT